MPSFYIFKDTNGRKRPPAEENCRGPCFISEGLRRYSGIPVCRDAEIPEQRDWGLPPWILCYIGIVEVERILWVWTEDAWTTIATIEVALVDVVLLMCLHIFDELVGTL